MATARATEEITEPAWHRRQRRKRTVARLLLNLSSAEEVLQKHHSAQQPSRATMPYGHPIGAAHPKKEAKGSGKGGKGRQAREKMQRLGYVVCASAGCNGWLWRAQLDDKPRCVHCGAAFRRDMPPKTGAAGNQGGGAETEVEKASRLLQELRDLQAAGKVQISERLGCTDAPGAAGAAPGGDLTFFECCEVPPLEENEEDKTPQEKRKLAEKRYRQAFHEVCQADQAVLRTTNEVAEAERKLEEKKKAKAAAEAESRLATQRAQEQLDKYHAASALAAQHAATAATAKTEAMEVEDPGSGTAAPAGAAQLQDKESQNTKIPSEEKEAWDAFVAKATELAAKAIQEGTLATTENQEQFAAMFGPMLKTEVQTTVRSIHESARRSARFSPYGEELPARHPLTAQSLPSLEEQKAKAERELAEAKANADAVAAEAAKAAELAKQTS